MKKTICTVLLCASTFATIAAQENKVSKPQKIRQPNHRRMVCRSGGSHTQQTILDLSNLFSQIQRPGFSGCIFFKGFSQMEKAFPHY